MLVSSVIPLISIGVGIRKLQAGCTSHKTTGIGYRIDRRVLCVVDIIAKDQSINQSVIISVAKIADAITKSTLAQLEDDART